MESLKQRTVLLGASNLQRSISTVVETAQGLWGSPLDVLAACGHGRAYGLTSCVLGRTLPAILACGLWKDLTRRPALPTAALLTDVGNDIVYGADADQVASWVRECCERLLPVCEAVVVTGLPLDSLRRLSGGRFRLLRTILFPRSRLTLERALHSTAQLDAQLRAMAEEYSVSFVTPRCEWYGWDPIHIRLRYWSRAWLHILSHAKPGTSYGGADGSLVRWITLCAQRPLYRKLFGITQHRGQPTCKLSDHSTVSLY
jgi:hypothetical protein